MYRKRQKKQCEIDVVDIIALKYCIHSLASLQDKRL